MLLRVGGIINTADLNSQTSNVIAIFLDSGLKKIYFKKYNSLINVFL